MTDPGTDSLSPPIFLGGAARSGTTLLRVMLDSHPRIACGPELKIVPDWLAKWHADRQTFGDYAAKHLGMDPEVMDEAYRAMLSSLFEWVVARSGKPRMAEKTPHNVIYFGHINQLFPESPLIHVIRDGRDVVASLLRMQWSFPDGRRVPYTENAEAAAQYWRDAVTAGIRARERLGDKVLEVRYENLVRETEAVMRQVLEHVNEPWDESVLNHDKYTHDLAGESSASEVSRPVTGAAIGKWRESLSSGDLDRVQRIAGELLARLGYD